jgi:bifunctional oligoribonuclease and PAP phosphatase NrnA
LFYEEQAWSGPPEAVGFMTHPLEESDRIREILRTKKRFVLTTHVNADGDGIGSELALYHHLRDLHKEVHIFNPSPMPETYRFLDPDHTKVQAYEEQHAPKVLETDALLVLDLANTERLGSLGRILGKRGPLRVCIDHHPRQDGSCDLAWIDDRASATGELVFLLLKQGGHEISRAIAEALYVALLTDTGCFRYANVTARTHRVVAELLETGIDPHGIYRRIYESNSWNQSMLFAAAISGLQRTCNGKVAWMRTTRQMFEETRAQEKDTEGLAEFPRGIGEVQISILFIEQAPDRVRVRFRSRHDVAVDALARELGGGGHRNASAALLEETSLAEAMDKVLTLAEKYVH